MKLLRKTFLTVTVSLFLVVLFAFATVLFAAACSDKVSLNFETFGGTKIETISMSAGSEIETPVDPEKEGYVFVGWYLDKSCEGDSILIPTVMPETSVTYYAKYEECPVLTLETDGGYLENTTFYVRKGTLLSDYLQEIIPQKQGLTFGVWLSDGEILDEDAVMPEENLTLTAKYKAAYTIEILLQSASSKTHFDVKDTRTEYDWEGETVTAEIPTYDHFYFDTEQSTAAEMTLTAGENAIRLRYMRERVDIHFTLVSPIGGSTAWDVQSFYGGSVTLPEGVSEEGYVFYGWANGQQSAASRFAGETITLGADDVYLYGVFAKTYENGRGSGKILAVSEAVNADGTQNVRFLASGAELEGVLNTDSYFSVGAEEGKIDGRGYYLLSDAGTYSGYSLSENKADSTLYGTLTLDFLSGGAVYSLNGETYAGTYDYEYDGESARYTGNYLFLGETETFLFRLNDGCFLREGEEKGSYYLYDCATGRYDETFILVLDGFGGVSFYSDGSVQSGLYYGGGAEEWIFSSDESSFRFMTGACGPTFGSSSKQVSVFLIYREDWAGRFTSDGGETLILDGYGYSAVYRTESGEEEGVYSIEGNVVTLKCASGTYTFIIDRSAGAFAPA